MHLLAPASVANLPDAAITTAIAMVNSKAMQNQSKTQRAHTVERRQWNTILLLKVSKEIKKDQYMRNRWIHHHTIIWLQAYCFRMTPCLNVLFYWWLCWAFGFAFGTFVPAVILVQEAILFPTFVGAAVAGIAIIMEITADRANAKDEGKLFVF